ncbi:hypothetical protein C0Z17_02745 [Trinickia caryophylli]|nr:hypothetical protein C0Z17_02745 [Trinickia caryophylli]
MPARIAARAVWEKPGLSPLPSRPPPTIRKACRAPPNDALTRITKPVTYDMVASVSTPSFAMKYASMNPSSVIDSCATRAAALSVSAEATDGGREAAAFELISTCA